MFFLGNELKYRVIIARKTPDINRHDHFRFGSYFSCNLGQGHIEVSSIHIYHYRCGASMQYHICTGTISISRNNDFVTWPDTPPAQQYFHSGGPSANSNGGFGAAICTYFFFELFGSRPSSNPAAFECCGNLVNNGLVNSRWRKRNHEIDVKWV